MTWIVDTIRAPRCWFSFVAVITFLGFFWIWASAVPAESTTSGRIPSPQEGFLAPEFTLERLGGEEIGLSDLAGQSVIVNLWASWCPPCRAEMPALEAVYQTYADDGLEILAVNMSTQDSLPQAAAFVQDLGLSFPILLDRQGEVARLYQSRALPSTFFIDSQGVIYRVVIGGPISEVVLQTTVEELLEASR
jgi:cytochrome c biogenesis protein CcmG/thiol:disulfide interchange protein DsbE